MAEKLYASIFMLVGLLAWTKATYVEAVAGAFDASQSQANLQIAMACGHYNKFIDLANGQWSDDLTSTCLVNKRDIMTYCRKKYPDYDITNIVEADHPRNITSWCPEDNPEECITTVLIVPFRCLVGSFESDALVVPNQCRFRHLHEEGSCQSPQQWKRAAKGSCRKTKMRLESTGMLLPCEEQVDLYQGVEYVCCPRPGRDAPTERREQQTNEDSSDPPAGEDPYFTEDSSEEEESTAYESAKSRLANKQREKVAKVMQQYREAQERLSSKDKKYLEKKGDIAKRYEETIADIEFETDIQEEHLHEVHESRIERKLSRKVTAEQERYIASLDEEPLKSKKILKAFEKYLKVVQKKRQHILSHYKHLRRTNPQRAQQVTDSVLADLKSATSAVNDNVNRLQKLPEIYREIESSISDLQNSYSEEADVRFIKGVQNEETEEREQTAIVEVDDFVDIQEVADLVDIEEDGAGVPTDDFPLATSLQNREDTIAKESMYEIQPTLPTEENLMEVEGEMDGDIESPTEFRTTLNVPEDDTEADPGIRVIAVKPIESYRDDETDFNGKTQFNSPLVVEKKVPSKDAHSQMESHVRSKSQLFSIDKSISKQAMKSTPALAFALACGILGVVMGLVVAVMVVRKKKRRVPVNQGFTEVDPNLTVEQRHIVSMQQNGYENPTYKYFEMQ